MQGGFHCKRHLHSQVPFTWQGQKDSTSPAGEAHSRLWGSTGAPFTSALFESFYAKSKTPHKVGPLIWQGQKDSNYRVTVFCLSFCVWESIKALELQAFSEGVASWVQSGVKA